MIPNLPINEFEKQFPSDKYKKQEFTFSKSELVILNTYHTIKSMGEMAGVLIDNLINTTVLPRIGIKPQKGVGTLYDNIQGIITVYTPLHYCNLCKDKPSEFSYDGKNYCDICLELIKTKEKIESENSNGK
ncbi:MAG: hypothetical protein PHE73_08735 [Sulfurovaceae bacterium]|nr:hypothetical protein [Sulfurovaceae bacterium]